MKWNGKPKLRSRILGILLVCILLAGDLLSAVQPVYADGRITTGKKTYTYVSRGRTEDSFSFSIGKGNVTVESVPQELLSKSKSITATVRKAGKWENGWENNQFVFEHENESRYRADIVSFPHKIPLPEDDGVYNLVVCVTGVDGSSESFNQHFTVAGSDAFFRLTANYEHNEKIFKKRYKSKTALWAFTRSGFYKKGSKEDKLIKKTAEKIVDKGDSDYEKVRKVHDWVANNIWYDLDYFRGKTKETDFDPVKILESKKTVCSGYAGLTMELLRSLGIPTKYVSGYAGGAHAWNEAYADGRWVLLDTTFDSNNRYENGTFSEAKPCYRYNFDESLEEFSELHYIGQDDYDPYWEVRNALSVCLSISKTNLTIKKGKTKQISVKSSEKGIDFKDLSITYSSSNKKVATVSKNGKIKGKKAGTAIIKTKIKMKELGKDTIITFETKVTVK